MKRILMVFVMFMLASTSYGVKAREINITDAKTGTKAKVTDNMALRMTSPPEGKSAFGETSVAEFTPSVNLSFAYNINQALVITRANNSGSISNHNNMAHIDSGSSSNSSSYFLSRSSLKYNPRQGALMAFTAVFSEGITNSTQLIGIGDSGDGLFFGYNGTSFGVMRRQGGMPEIRSLGISTASTTAEDITITLDGVSITNVTVSNNGNLTITANEIAAADYSNVGSGWDAEGVGTNVIFTAWDASPRTNSYSLSGASTAVGTFTARLGGVSPNETWHPQETWNGDKFDGSGSSGINLVHTNGNLYQIKFQWLGFGAITFFIEDPEDGELHVAHRIPYANAFQRPSINNPSLPIYAFVGNQANTNSIGLRTGSMAAGIEGRDLLLGPRRGESFQKTVGVTEIPVITIRNKRIFSDVLNRTKIKLIFISAASEHSKPILIRFYVNSTLVDSSFVDVDSNQSVVSVDTSATAFSGGIKHYTFPLAKADSEAIDLQADHYSGVLLPGNTLTATAQTSTGGGDITVSYYWVELF